MIIEPIIVLGAPRSGTTIVQRCLAIHPDLWHLTSESHFILEGPFHPASSGYQSNRVEHEDVAANLLEEIRNQFEQNAINLNRVIADPIRVLSARRLSERLVSKVAIHGIGRLSRRNRPNKIRLLEKTPKNVLRVPLLEALFPDARYVWVQRQAAENIDSLLVAWRAVDKFGPFKRRRFGRSGYPIADQLKLQDYDDKWWKFALVPDWHQLEGKTLADVATWQYHQCNRYLAEDLAQLPAERVFPVQYEEFVQHPNTLIQNILTWADLPNSKVVERFAERLPRINTTHSGQSGKLHHPQAIQAALARIADTGITIA